MTSSSPSTAGRPACAIEACWNPRWRRPRNQFEYGESSLARLAAAYAFGISRNHPFLDGNKRTSLVVAELFLELNGLELAASDAACVATFLEPRRRRAHRGRPHPLGDGELPPGALSAGDGPVPDRVECPPS